MSTHQLIDQGLLTPLQYELILAQRDRLLRSGTKKSIADLAIEAGFVKSHEVDAGAHTTTKDYIDPRLAQSLKVMPAFVREGVLTIYIAKQLSSIDTQRIEESVREYDDQITSVNYVPGDIQEILRWIHQKNSLSKIDLVEKAEMLSQSPNNPIVIQDALETLYSVAIMTRSSDIHLRRDRDTEQQNSIEFRIDGTLRTMAILSHDAMSALFARIKGLANLDISNSLVPQDGRKSMTFKGRKIDMRIATIPTIDGEKITIRMLDPENLLTLDDMFYPYPGLLERVKAMSDITPGVGGMMIISGPTGSGKTTTNYAIIRELDRIGLNIMTTEDPVEYEMPLIVQSQVNDRAGAGFTELLRAQLRNDPDVLLIGEMRDAQTAEIAVRSADTGHAIFTTLHTDDAISTVNRFISMLPSEFSAIGRKAIASNLKAIVNQRLARKLCSCAEKTQVTPDEFDFFALPEGHHFVHVGCRRCDGTGYRGRVLVPEALFFESKKVSKSDVGRVIEEGKLTKEFAESSKNIYYFTLKEACERLLDLGAIDLPEAKKIMGI